MPYREVTMLETKELLRLWMDGMGIRTIAGFLGLDPKTVRRYIEAGREHGLSPEDGSAALTDDMVVAVMAAFRSVPGRPRGESWDLCRTHRAFIEEHLRNGARLTKVRKLLHRIGVSIPHGTLHRFAGLELEFGRVRVTVPVADGGPGEDAEPGPIPVDPFPSAADSGRGASPRWRVLRERALDQTRQPRKRVPHVHRLPVGQNPRRLSHQPHGSPLEAKTTTVRKRHLVRPRTSERGLRRRRNHRHEIAPGPGAVPPGPPPLKARHL